MLCRPLCDSPLNARARPSYAIPHLKPKLSSAPTASPARSPPAIAPESYREQIRESPEECHTEINAANIRHGMQKEEWMSIDEDIPVTATITDLEICQHVCEQDQAIQVDDSDGNECVEDQNPPTNAEMRQALDIVQRGVQHRSTNF
ncbi:hypothetical protein AVEN_183467-1 [Araneus ventricosus]|uniref:Uncharacterized protein n=1 Tax=Araneus ventricosus TaxID=182803 RepID=A0A4Y2TQ35_ARAVE|nr:hypothetical protein AVEN_183467-1 [Araneus ventricosus]